MIVLLTPGAVREGGYNNDEIMSAMYRGLQYIPISVSQGMLSPFFMLGLALAMRVSHPSARFAAALRLSQCAAFNT